MNYKENRKIFFWAGMGLTVVGVFCVLVDVQLKVLLPSLWYAFFGIAGSAATMLGVPCVIVTTVDMLIADTLSVHEGKLDRLLRENQAQSLGGDHLLGQLVPQPLLKLLVASILGPALRKNVVPYADGAQRSIEQGVRGALKIKKIPTKIPPPPFYTKHLDIVTIQRDIRWAAIFVDQEVPLSDLVKPIVVATSEILSDEKAMNAASAGLLYIFYPFPISFVTDAFRTEDAGIKAL